jgi:DNA-binding NarL/FixJ family response regulator
MRRVELAVITERELEVLALVAEGWNNSEIGPMLGISEEGIKSHMRNITKALGARNRTHCVVIAMRAGMIK